MPDKGVVLGWTIIYKSAIKNKYYMQQFGFFLNIELNTLEKTIIAK